MTLKLVITPGAEADLDGLFTYIAQDSPANARKFVSNLRKRLKTLTSLPRRCPRAPEDGLDGLEIRHLLHKDYRILFAIDGQTVVILQVLHGSRLATGDDQRN
ncbi:MAG: type II toxin-antitoxin system RelE/ParE family toxin [Rhodospirillales bacterium]|nr:type II toxin-antitoxin system RelE/ParE family toxin [Rhodospirillales bacterium]